jgi:hypothetical protein
MQRSKENWEDLTRRAAMPVVRFSRGAQSAGEMRCGFRSQQENSKAILVPSLTSRDWFLSDLHVREMMPDERQAVWEGFLHASGRNYRSGGPTLPNMFNGVGPGSRFARLMALIMRSTSGRHAESSADLRESREFFERSAMPRSAMQQSAQRKARRI